MDSDLFKQPLSSTGILSGIIGSPGNYTFTVQAADSASNKATQTFSLPVIKSAVLGVNTFVAGMRIAGYDGSQFMHHPGNGLQRQQPDACVLDHHQRPSEITSSNALPNGVIGLSYSQLLAATGGVPPYAWSVAAGQLPAGLQLASSGAITGTPTVAGSTQFTLQAADSARNVATQALSMIIVPPLSITTSSPLLSGVVNAPYWQSLDVSGGTGPYSWSIVAGSLPDGLTLSPGGVISGTPAMVGNSIFTVQAIDSLPVTGSRILAITVLSGPAYTIDSFAGPGLSPDGLAADSQGNLYIADPTAHVVWIKSPAGDVSVFAGTGTPDYSGDGGPANAAGLNEPRGIAIDSSGNVWITDSANNCVREVTVDGTIQTVAGPGSPGTSGDGGSPSLASLDAPYGLAFDAAGDLFIAESGANRVRVIANGVIQTVVALTPGADPGDGGVAMNATLQNPTALALDTSGALYIADQGHHRVRRVAPMQAADVSVQYQAGTITTLDGTGIPGTSADQLELPLGIAIDASGNIIISDSDNNRILQLAPTGAVTVIAGNGEAGYSGDGGLSSGASISHPTGMVVDSFGKVYFSDQGNGAVRVQKLVP